MTFKIAVVFYRAAGTVQNKLLYCLALSIKRNTYRILKENRMEERMTDFQFNKLLQMVLEIMKSSKSLDEAIAKVERLTKKGA